MAFKYIHNIYLWKYLKLRVDFTKHALTKNSLRQRGQGQLLWEHIKALLISEAQKKITEYFKFHFEIFYVNLFWTLNLVTYNKLSGNVRFLPSHQVKKNNIVFNIKYAKFNYGA